MIEAYRGLNQALQYDRPTCVQPQRFSVFMAFIVVSGDVKTVEIGNQPRIHVKPLLVRQGK
jgi:hypothetical protein